MSEARRERDLAPLPPLFSVRDLSVSFDRGPVLSVGSLDIEEGRITVMVGENGSGKTTLLRVLNGLLRPSSGSALYRGEPISADSFQRIRRESVLVHQSPLMIRGTVFQNVAYGLKVRGLYAGREGERIAKTLSLVGLEGSERRRAAALSGGEKQRVAIARALAIGPRVLFLDEPTANIDPESRRTIEGVVREAAKSGATVIMSSHDLEFAYRLCDRLVPIEAGMLTACRDNIFRGSVAGTDDQFTLFRSGSAILKCPARVGDFVTAVIPLDDVILSRAEINSSARNQFRGRVLHVEEEGGVLRVSLDCGFPLQAFVTRSAAVELSIEAGSDFFTTFKASAIRLY
jgi:tungstate transport system ATP-binding protein